MREGSGPYLGEEAEFVDLGDDRVEDFALEGAEDNRVEPHREGGQPATCADAEGPRAANGERERQSEGERGVSVWSQPVAPFRRSWRSEEERARALFASGARQGVRSVRSACGCSGAPSRILPFPGSKTSVTHTTNPWRPEQLPSTLLMSLSTSSSWMFGPKCRG